MKLKYSIFVLFISSCYSCKFNSSKVNADTVKHQLGVIELVEIRNLELLNQKYLLEIKLAEIEFKINDENRNRVTRDKEWQIHLTNNISKEIYCELNDELKEGEVRLQYLSRKIDSLKSNDLIKKHSDKSLIKHLQGLDSILKETNNLISEGAWFNCN